MNCRDGDGNTGLMLAICYKKQPLVDLLLERWQSATCLAFLWHELKFLRIICNFQSSILVSTDDMYKTPGFLHRQDVDVNLSNKAGLTALHLACQAGNTLLVCACHPLKEANSKELSSSLQSRDLARQNNFPRKHCCSRCCTQKNVHTVLDCLCDKVDGWVG